MSTEESFKQSPRQQARGKLLKEVLSAATPVQLFAFRQVIWNNYCAGWNYYDMKGSIAAIDDKRFDDPHLVNIIRDEDVMWVMQTYK